MPLGACLPPSCISLEPPGTILDEIWSILGLILGAFWRQFAYFFAPFSHLVPEWRFRHNFCLIFVKKCSEKGVAGRALRSWKHGKYCSIAHMRPFWAEPPPDRPQGGQNDPPGLVSESLLAPFGLPLASLWPSFFAPLFLMRFGGRFGLAGLSRGARGGSRPHPLVVW